MNKVFTILIVFASTKGVKNFSLSSKRLSGLLLIMIGFYFGITRI